VAADNAHLDAGAEIEDLGYDTIWVAGGQLDRLDRSTTWSGRPGRSR